MTALDEFTDMKKKSLAVRLEAELLTADQQTTEELVIQLQVMIDRHCLAGFDMIQNITLTKSTYV